MLKLIKQNFDFIKEQLSTKKKVAVLYAANYDFCQRKNISMEDMKLDIKKGYLYPSQLGEKYANTRLYYVHIKGGFERVIHPNDKD